MCNKKHEMRQTKSELGWEGASTKRASERGKDGQKKHGVNSKCYRSGSYVVRFTNMRKI